MSDYKKLAENTSIVHIAMHEGDFEKCGDVECQLARAVLELEAENRRLRAALEEIGDDADDPDAGEPEYCGCGYNRCPHEIAREALKK